MTALNDDELRRLLRDLPRQEVSEDFTERVMGRLARTPSRRPSRRRGLWAAAAAAVVVTGVWWGGRELREQEALRRAARAQELRQEYEALQRELQTLRSLTTEAEPVIELGGTPDIDFVFDLERFAREMDAMNQNDRARTQSISHRAPTRD